MQTQGDRVIDFIETFLTLGGSWRGQPFIMLPWMKDAVREMYRIDPDTGLRKYRTFLLGVPRKNAKSTLGAALAVYGLVADSSDAAPQVISAAGDRKQARLVFDEAKRMILSSPELKAVTKTYRDEILCPANGGMYRAASADAELAQGLNPSLVIFDEHHVQKRNDLWDALNLGSATRRQPLTLSITTAGWDLDSPLGMLYQYARKVHAGEIDDPTMGLLWYGPEEGEEFDPADEETWKRFNPSWEIMNPAEFRSAFRTTPLPAFVRYRLNGWTTGREGTWIPPAAWRATEAADKSLEIGDEVVLGFDGAWKGDSTALVAIRLEDLHLEVLGHWEGPVEDTTWRTPVWEVEDAIREACQRYAVREVAADPFRFEQTLVKLGEEGLPITEYRSNSLALIIPATQMFYEAVMDERLSHSADPALARHIANAVLKVDARGARITKEYRSSSRHIDLAVAAVIAFHRAVAWRDDAPGDPQLIVI